MRMLMRVASRIGRRGRAAHARDLAYPFFVSQPQRRRPHERLVIEAGGQQREKKLLILLTSKLTDGQQFWLVAMSPS